MIIPKIREIRVNIMVNTISMGIGGITSEIIASTFLNFFNLSVNF
jgi:hypothetical protein